MNQSNKKTWYLYIIEAENGFYYTGITNDLKRRFKEHLEGRGGAKFFRTSPPKEIVYTEEYETKSQALKREYAIKKMTRKKKQELINEK
jgi:putative endonuclease